MTDSEKKEKIILRDHTDLEWVDEMGPCILDVIAQEKGELNLSLHDHIVLMLFIKRNAAHHLIGINIGILNAYEQMCPDDIGWLDNVITFYEDKTNKAISRKKLATVFNQIVMTHKDKVVEYMKLEKKEKARKAHEGLFNMMRYVMTTDEIEAPELIRETIRIIESKLPPVAKQP